MVKRFFLLGMILLSACASTEKASLRAQPEPASAALAAPASPANSATSLAQPVCNCVLRFDRITIEQGLSQSSVRVVFQDQRGFIWFGTQDGLNRYDGYNFTIFKPDPDSPTSISDRWVNAIAEDKQGYLWIGTGFGGLNRYDPRSGEFKHYQHDDNNPFSLISDKVIALYADNQNKLWVGTKNGLDILDLKTNKFRHYTYELGRANRISSKYITSIYEGGDGLFWIGTWDGGLNSFDPETGIFTAYRHSQDDLNSISSNQVNSIAQDEKGYLWVATSNGLNRFSPKTNSFLRFQVDPSRPNHIASSTVLSVHVDSTGGIWVGTSAGLERLNTRNNKFTHYTHDPSFSQSISHNYILSIFEDRGGVLWFGTNDGVNKYDRDRDKFAYFRNETNNPNSLSDNYIFAIHPDKFGDVWVGTSDGGLNRFNRLTNQVVRFENDPNDPNSILSNEVLAIEEDVKGIFWIGTSNGMDRFDRRTNTFTHFRRDPNKPDKTLSGNMVYTILENDAKELWIGTNAGLDIFDKQSQAFTHFHPQTDDPKSLSGGSVDSILKDSQGYYWIGTVENGLNKFDPQTKTFTQYHHSSENKQSISSDSILSVYQDTQGRLWVGTGGGGLNLYHPDTDSFTYFLEKDGLPNSVIYGIVEDDQGYLWLSTNFGLSRFDPDAKTFTNYDSGDGLQSNEFNMGAYAKGSRGEIYFGGVNGLTMFRPLTITSNPRLPQVSITSLTREGQAMSFDSSIETLKDITLYWPHNSFEFEFASLSYNEPLKNQYAYKLEGFEDNWNFIGKKRDGRYTNLPGGQFTLLLKASNADGVWNETPIRMNVTVVPPFWETVWFRVFLVIGFSLAVVVGYRLRLESIQNRNRELEQVVEQRTGELKKRNTEIEALYQADEKILRNVSLNQVFQTLVDVAVEILKADKSVVLAWNTELTCVMPRVSKGFSPETLKVLKFGANEGLVGKSLRTGEVVLVPELNPAELRPDIAEAIEKEGIRCFVHMPITVDNRVVGIFNVGFTRPNAINEETVKLFTALVQRASLSIANMELFEQTKDLAVMEERNRLARDLHDSAKQKAFAALAQLGTTRGIIKNNGDTTLPHLNEAENLVHDVIQELTFLIQEIYPIALQEKGLLATLREYIYEWEGHNDIRVNLSINDEERRLPLKIEQPVYRVIQEALANVARHSGAKQVDLCISYLPEALEVVLTDDGVGFDATRKSRGMGLLSMRERLGGIRGTIQIQSAAGMGTRLSIHVPVRTG